MENQKIRRALIGKVFHLLLVAAFFVSLALVSGCHHRGPRCHKDGMKSSKCNHEKKMKGCDKDCMKLEGCSDCMKCEKPGCTACGKKAAPAEETK